MPEETTVTTETEVTTTETPAGEKETASEEKGSWIEEFLKGSETEEAAKEEVKEIMIPKKRFDTVNQKLKDLADAAAAKDAEYGVAAKEAAKQADVLKEVQEIAKTQAARVEKLETTIKTMYDAKLATINEAYHELIPADISIEEKLDWVTKAEGKGLFGAREMTIEIGGMSNPTVTANTQKFEGLSPLQMMAMGYGSK